MQKSILLLSLLISSLGAQEDILSFRMCSRLALNYESYNFCCAGFAIDFLAQELKKLRPELSKRKLVKNLIQELDRHKLNRQKLNRQKLKEYLYNKYLKW